MVSLILRREFFEFGQEKFVFREAFDLRPFFGVNGDLKFFFRCFRYFKIIENIEFLTRKLRPLCARWAYVSGTYAHAERTFQALMRALSIRVGNWCVH